MDDPFFAEDDGEFDDFYGNGSRNTRPSQAAMPRPSDARESALRSAPSLAYPDTPASSVASFVSKSTDVTTSTPMGNAQKRAKKHRRRRSQELFQGVEWEKDVDVSACFVCANDFSLLKRKHHCRHCGRVICSDCSSYWRFPGSYGKHRVCSYCNVELANGAGRHTMAATGRMSMSEAETPTEPKSKTHQSFVGVFSSDKPRQKESTGRKNERGGVAYEEPSSELFDTNDDAWFADPVDDGDRGKTKRRSSKNEERRSEAYLRPKVIEKRDSLFAVQFTNDNQSDDASEDDNDAFAMPKPTNESKRPAAGASTRPSAVRSGYSSARSDDRMTMDDLMPSSASASYVSTADSYDNTMVVARPTLKPAADRATFYSDDADKLIVDEAPGYYDSVMREHQKSVSLTPGYAVAPAMPRPSVVGPSSDNSSGTLIEAPEIAAASAAAHQAEQTRRKSHSPEGKEGSRGFTGALKRFFGMSKSKPSADPPVAPAPRPDIRVRVETARPTQTVPPSVSPVQPSPASPTEQIVPLEMPRPTTFGVPEPTARDELDYDPRVLAPDEHSFDARYTIADTDRFRAEAQSNVAFRHTMTGYLVPSSQAPAESLVRASVIGGSADTKKDGKKERRRSSRNRRDTFGDLFDSPTKKSADSFAPSASTIAGLPTRSWKRDDAYGARITGPVGADRFDRPRHDEPDEDLTQDLSKPGMVNAFHAPNPRTQWNAVSSYTSPAPELAATATPSYYDVSRETAYRDQYETYDAVPGSARQYEDYREEEPRRTIMDDLRGTSSTPSGRAVKQKDSIDDFFADFEKPNDYVFDSNSGTYVPANVVRAPQIYEDRIQRPSLQPVSAPRQVESRREERPRASTRRSEVLEPVVEDQPDEIDGIIVDKISTLEGELEALKQLLRKRGMHQPASPPRQSRKQSIFDSDGSEEEQKPRKKKSSTTKRRSSSKKEVASEASAIPQKSRRQRKDSFADLFEDDVTESQEQGVLGTRNYEALFQIGEGISAKAGDGSDEERGETKLSGRKIKRGSQRPLSDSGSDSSKEKPSTSRFSKGTKRSKSKRREDSDDADEKPTARFSVVAVEIPPKETVKPKAKRKDSIDALFDSGSDHDMDSLFDSSAKPDATKRNDIEERAHSSEDGVPEIKHRTSKRGSRRQRSEDVMEVMLESVPSESLSIVPTKEVSSDEEFTSTLKTLRNRRASKTPVSSGVPVQPVRADSSEDEENQASPLPEPTRLGSSSRLLGQLFTPPDEDPELQAEYSDLEPPANETVPHNGSFVAEEKRVEMTIETKKDHGADEDQASAPRDDAIVPHDESSPNTAMETTEEAVIEGLPEDELAGRGFDPLALLDDDDTEDRNVSKPASSRELVVKSVEPEPVDEQLWEPEVSLASSQMKALRFRDGLLDRSSSDVLGRPPSLNLDDLLGGPSSGLGDLSEEDRSDDDDPGFSFEIKPKLRFSKSTAPPEDTPSPAIDVSEATDPVELDTEETIVLKTRSPRALASKVDDELDVMKSSGEQVDESTWGSASVTSSTDDADLLATETDNAQFQDDWQRLQEQEKERKKKLQLKQRQAQREKLKKQSSSGRTLGKSSGSSRALESSESPETSTRPEKSSKGSKHDSSEGKKKKKHRKKAEDDGEAEEEGKSRRKSDKRRHRDRDQGPIESSGFDVDTSQSRQQDTEGPGVSQDGLTEL